MGPIPGILNHRRKTGGRRKAHFQEHQKFPHFSTAEPSMCMCLDTCCQDDNGCICPRCPCKYGVTHIDALAMHRGYYD